MNNELLIEYLKKFNDFYISTIEPYITADYQGKPFELFGVSHLAALGVILFIIVLFFISRRNFREHKKVDIRDTMATILILNEIGWHLWNYFFNEWTLQTMLPLHLCSILV